MKCEDLLRAINEFVDGEVDPALCDDFQHHLAGCNPCQVVVDNIRHTIKLYQNGEPYPLPSEFSQRLNNRLRTHWQAKFPLADR